MIFRLQFLWQNQKVQFCATINFVRFFRNTSFVNSYWIKCIRKKYNWVEMMMYSNHVKHNFDTRRIYSLELQLVRCFIRNRYILYDVCFVQRNARLVGILSKYIDIESNLCCSSDKTNTTTHALIHRAFCTTLTAC